MSTSRRASGQVSTENYPSFGPCSSFAKVGTNTRRRQGSLNFHQNPDRSLPASYTMSSLCNYGALKMLSPFLLF